MSANSQTQLGNKLIRYGILLFLLGLLTGLVIPAMRNPRMGLSSHLEGTMNGMLLILFGLILPKVRLTNWALNWSYGLSLFGTYTNWGTTLLAGIWGAGAEMMPFAGGALHGAAWQEIIVKVGLVTLSLAMIAVCGILLYGMRGNASEV